MSMDIEENKKDIAPADNAPAAQAPTHKEKHRTVGNHLYDWGVYGTVAWMGVAAVSLLSAHEAKFGNNKYFGWLRWIDKNATSGLKKLFSKTPVVKSFEKETVDGLAKGTTMFLTLGMGGHALMPLIKWMEDNRQKNAACIDNALGTTPPDPETIEKEPKQTWKSVFSGRMLSWGMSYAAFLAMGPKLTSRISEKSGEVFTNCWMGIREGIRASFKPSVVRMPEHEAALRTKVRKWADIGAFDALFTVITATMTFAFSRYVAKHDKRNMDAESVLMTIDPVTSTPFAPVYAPQEAESKHYTAAVGKRPAQHADYVNSVAEGGQLAL